MTGDVRRAPSPLDRTMTATLRHSQFPWVALAHVAGILLLALVGMPRTRTPEFIRVSLATPSGSPSEPAAPADPSPAPASPPPAVSPPPETTDSGTESSQPESSEPRTPKWKPRSADDIRKRGLDRSAPSPVPARPTGPAIDAASIRESLTNVVAGSQGVEVTLASAQVSSAQSGRYAGVLRSVLYRKWRQPKRSEVGADSPGVQVEFSVAGDGRVMSSRIRKGSGNARMDSSVKTMLASLTRLPPPASFGVPGSPVSFSVTFELE